MAAAAAPRSVGGSTVQVQYTDGDAADAPTPAISGVGRRLGLNLFSGPVCGAIFGSFALCIVIICVYSFLARRRAVSGARSRFLRRISDVPLSGWSADVPIPAATSTRLGEPPPPPRILPVYVSPAPPSAPDRRAPGDNSNSGLGDCPVCLEPLRVGCGDDVRAAHACGHVFHSHCIQPWLHQRGSCPVCRCTLNSTFTSNSSSTRLGVPPAAQAVTTTTTASLPVDEPPAPPPVPDRRAPGANSNSGLGDCPVCLEPLRVGCGDVRAAHACGHVFHSHCIQPWLHQRGSCPVCRCTLNSTPTSIPTSNSNTNSNSTSTAISNTNATSTSNSGGPVDDCPLCLDPLHIGGGAMAAVHVCGHTFHSRCIEWWLCHRTYCPMCRCTVRLCIRDPRNEVTSASAAPSGGAGS